MAEKLPKVLYDRESDSLYIVISKGPEEGFMELAPDINLEPGRNGKVIGIEILKASKVLGKIASSHKPHSLLISSAESGQLTGLARV